MFEWYRKTAFSNPSEGDGVAIAPGGLSDQDVRLLNGFGTAQDAQCVSLATMFPDNPILAMQLQFGVQRAAMRAQPVVESGLQVFLDHFPPIGEVEARIADEGPSISLGQLPTGESFKLPVRRLAGTSILSGPTNAGKTTCLKNLLWQLMQLNEGSSA